MNKARRNSILAALVVLALAPAFSFAQSSSQGFSDIVSCGQQQGASLPSSVGSFAATGGVYVPVSDATVELNTGTLVYKECVLRVLVDAEKQAMTAGLQQNATNNVLTGRNGSTQFVQQINNEVNIIGTNAIQAFLQNDLTTLDPNIQTQVKQAIAQGYATAVNNPSAMLTCQYQGATTDFTSANPQGNIWNDILAVASPCDPVFGYIDANDLALGSVSQEINCQQEQWQWGGGWYSVTQGSGGPCEQTIETPSSNANGSYQNITQTGFNQLQSANDIGQLIQPLFAGISSEVLAGTYGGIAGLTQPIGNQPSYLQQATQQESGNYQNIIGNNLIQSIMTDIQNETAFQTVAQQIQGILGTAASQLNQQQSACWQTIAQSICGSSFTLSSSNTTCAAQDGTHITFATSTENFAAAAIVNSQFLNNTTVANNDASSSQAILTQLQTLLQEAGTNQNAASQGWNAMHSQVANSTQITNITSLEQQISTYLGSPGGTGFVQNVISSWQGNTGNTDSSGNPVVMSWAGNLPPNGTDTGWCNATASTTATWKTKL